MDTHWNNEKESQVRYMSDICKGYTWMCKYDMRSYSRVYNWGTNTVILGTELSAVLGSIGLATNVNGFLVAAQIISFLIGLIAGVIKYNEYENKIGELKRLIVKFISLSNNIQRQLNTSVNRREDYDHYILWITKSYEELIEVVPDYLSENAQRKYESVARDCGMPHPNDLESSYQVKNKKVEEIIIENTKEPDEEKKEEIDEQKNKELDRQKTIKKLKYQHQGTLFHDISMFTDESMKYELERLKAHD